MTIENNRDHLVDSQGFRGNTLLKRKGVKVNWTPELVEEWLKCKNDPIYFAENYVKIITEDGLVPIKLRDYQKEFLMYMVNERETMALQSRQSGKCLRINTTVRIRNKKTKEILTVDIGELIEIARIIEATSDT